MGTRKQYLMALDFGTGAGRCVLAEVSGQETHTGYIEWAFDAPPDAQPGGFSFDPEHFWAVLGDASRQAMRRGGVRPEQVIAVSTTALREGFVLLDEAGKEIWAVPNRDARAYRESAEVSARLGQRMNDVSGHWPNPIMAPSRFLWLQRNQPHVLERTRTLLMINDWMVYCLCGEKACEPTNAAETCLFDIAELDWDAGLIEACGVPREIFPPIARNGTVLGSVTAQAAEETGLLEGTAVVVGGADTQCGVLGSGAVEPGQTVIVAGTSTPIQMVLPKPVIDTLGRTWSGPHVPKERWVLESNAGATGSVQRWFRDSFCQEEMAAAERGEGDVYALMTAKAMTSPIGSGGVVCLTGFRVMNARGVGAPVMSGFVIGNERAIMAETDSKRHFLRSMLESHAFAARGNIAQLQEIAGSGPTEVIICGGWSNSDIWAQMVADVMGTAVHRPRVAEATAVGTAVCGGVGVGVYQDIAQGVESLVRMRELVEPDLGRQAQYEAPYQAWLALRSLNPPTAGA